MARKKIQIEDVVEFLPTTTGGIDAVVRTADGNRAVESLVPGILEWDGEKPKMHLVLDALNFYLKHKVLHQEVVGRLLEEVN